MAAAAPELNIYFLHDVDSNMTERNSISESLVSLAKFIQDDLISKGEDFGKKINVVHRLFTSRIIVFTVKYLYFAYLSCEEEGKSWRDTVELLSNLVNVLRNQGLNMCAEIPVIQGGDAAKSRALGDSFKEIYQPFEERLLGEEGEKLLRAMDDKAKSILTRKDKSVITKEKMMWVWDRGLDQFMGAFQRKYMPGAEKEDEIVKKRMKEFDEFKEINPELELLVAAIEKDEEIFSEQSKSGAELGKKTHILAKVFEELIKKHGENFLIIWTDDREELYLEVMRSEIEINKKSIAAWAEEHVVFVHHDVRYDPMSELGKVEYQRSYLKIINDAVKASAKLTDYHPFFSTNPQSALTIAKSFGISGGDGPVGAMPLSLESTAKAASASAIP